MQINVMLALLAGVSVVASCGEASQTPGPAPAAAPAAAATPSLLEDRPALEISAEELEPGWVKGGYHPSALVNANPTWGSYSEQGDAATGSASVTFAVPAGVERIAIPVTTGPTRTALSLSVVDSAGNIIASLEPTEDYATWKLWEVSLPAGTPLDSLTISGADTGGEWGQWIAFGQPRVL